MAKSSIHLQTAKGGTILHNARENYSKSVVFTDEKNELWNDSKTAFKMFRDELEIRTKAYTERTGQKLHKTTSTLISGVVNLEQNHTLKDMEKIKDYLEKEFDTKVIQMSVHRDEGKLINKENEDLKLVSGKDFFLNAKDNELYFDSKFTKKINMDEWKIEKNYHGHFEMLGLDTQGKTLRKKMNIVKLSKLQDFTAQSLGMERSLSNVIVNEKGKAQRKSTTNKKRLDTHEFKEQAKIINETKKDLVSEKELNKELASSKDLQEINKQLREELKEMEALRADFAQLEALNKDLKEQVKNKTLTIEELNNIINEYKQNRAQKTNENILDDKSIPEKEKEVLGSLKDDFQSELETNKKGLLGKSYEVKLKEEFSHSPNVESLTLFMRVKKKLTNAYDIIKAQALKILNLETENKSLKKENDKLSRELREAELEIKELSKDKSELSPLNSEKKETALDKLVTNYEKSKKDKTLEEILKSPVKKEDLDQATKEVKAYIKKETPASQIRKQGRGIG